MYKKKHWHIIKNTQLWQSTKLLQITSENMDWRVAGYIIGNLLKHKEVSTFQELQENKFSSYWYYAKKYGEQEMQELVRSVIDIPENNKGFIDMKDLSDKKLGLKPNYPSAKAG